MNTEAKKRLKIGFSVLLAMILTLSMIFQMMLHISGNERYFSGEVNTYYQSLISAGFPADYASALTELHLLHPSWSFEPLLITDQNANFTWDYVINKETEKPDLNLISSDADYEPYWHETNRTPFDSGLYQPSRAAVEYFMDPRNFLNEADIFQFFDQSAQLDPDIVTEAVEAVLKGTFMESETLENELTYAENFCKIGKELNVNPVFLAVKVRQEQGVGGTSDLISGQCGTKLNEYYTNQTQATPAGRPIMPPAEGTRSSEELLALNGFYNYFNIAASGDGIFQIYENAMKRAKNVGTAEMASVWDGSPAWNTRWKSLYGGGYFLKKNYIGRHQETSYLQKFNVDPRATDLFTHQYMQSITGGLSEGRILFQSFASIDILDQSHTFVIPVYQGMPASPCPDPANGSVTATKPSVDRYSVSNKMSEPISQSDINATIYAGINVQRYESLKLDGKFTHSYGVERLEYAWDTGAWSLLSNDTTVSTSIPIAFAENTTHILKVRAKANYGGGNNKHSAYVLCAVLYVGVSTPATATLTFEAAGVTNQKEIVIGRSYHLPKSDAPDFAGWLGSDGTFLPSGADITVWEDVTYRAVFLDFASLKGASLSLTQDEPYLRFSAVLRNQAYQELITHDPAAIVLSAEISADGELLSTKTPSVKSAVLDNKLCFYVDTDPIAKSDYETDYSVVFSAFLTYTDGTTKALSPAGDRFARSVTDVAKAALNDNKTTYSPNEIAFLNSLIE